MARTTFGGRPDDRLGNKNQPARVVKPVGHSRFLNVRRPAKAPSSGAEVSALAGGSRSALNIGGGSGGPKFASPVAVAKALASRSGRPPAVTPPGLSGEGTPPAGPKPIRSPLAMPGEQPSAPPARTDASTGKTFATAPPPGEYGGDPLSPVWGVTPAGAQRQPTISLIEALKGIRGKRIE